MGFFYVSFGFILEREHTQAGERACWGMEREIERERERERERMRERENPKQAPHSAWGLMQGSVPRPWDHDLN